MFITTTNESQIQSLIFKFVLVVLRNELPKHLPPSHNVDHEIEVVPRLVLLSKLPHWLNQKELQELKAQINNLMERRYIKQSKSPYGFHVLLVDKKDGNLWMCIDYCALNKITIENNYPLPRIDDLFNHSNGAYYFYQIDLKSIYHQIGVGKVDVKNMAMRTNLMSSYHLGCLTPHPPLPP